VIGIPDNQFLITQNNYTIHLKLLPTITNYYPANIYNVALVNQIVITGRDFLNTEDLVCVI
jgi:hypothetical protein